MIPDGAVYEARLAGGVALLDVSHLLPRHPTKHYRKRREPWAVERVYMHHSGAMGLMGYEGARGSARYCVQSRGWPGMPYTYWLSFVPDRTEADELVVYRCQRDEVRSYHTGGSANTHGVGVCWQGRLTSLRPSPAQYEMAEALVPWLEERHQLRTEWLSWHSEAHRYGGRRKAACPGPFVVDWAREWRDAT